MQLQEYAFFNAHKLRHPVANIMGLTHLIKVETNPEEQQVLLNYLDKSVEELDKVVHQIQHIVAEPEKEY
ncbi:MAG: hypothetical protein HC913_14000 [Microscillaceae bacterium]|nr:hypothetical protein [Microscillaceae bacterium]